MPYLPFINIHTHQKNANKNVLAIRNLSNDEPFPPHEFVSLGLHPWHIDPENYKEQLASLEQKLKRHNFIAIGECGLDPKSPVTLNLQLEILKKQAHWADKMGLPLIIHCLKYYPELIRLRKQNNFQQPWIIHGFNSSKQQADELIKNNCFLSFGHLLLNPVTKARQIFADIPLTNLFLETDEANQDIMHIYTEAAKLKSIASDVLKKHIFVNFKRIFPDGSAA